MMQIYAGVQFCSDAISVSDACAQTLGSLRQLCKGALHAGYISLEAVAVGDAHGRLLAAAAQARARLDWHAHWHLRHRQHEYQSTGLLHARTSRHARPAGADEPQSRHSGSNLEHHRPTAPVTEVTSHPQPRPSRPAENGHGTAAALKSQHPWKEVCHAEASWR